MAARHGGGGCLPRRGMGLRPPGGLGVIIARRRAKSQRRSGNTRGAVCSGEPAWSNRVLSVRLQIMKRARGFSLAPVLTECGTRESARWKVLPG